MGDKALYTKSPAVAGIRGAKSKSPNPRSIIRGLERGSLTVDVVEAEGDGERESIGVAAVAAAGPDLPHLQASEVRRGAARRGETMERRGRSGYPDGKLGVRE